MTTDDNIAEKPIDEQIEYWQTRRCNSMKQQAIAIEEMSLCNKHLGALTQQRRAQKGTTWTTNKSSC